MGDWRGKIGIACPAADTGVDYVEHAALLPAGVIMTMATLGVEILQHEDIEKTVNRYPEAIRFLASMECDVIISGGALPFIHMGWDKGKAIIDELRKSIGVPVIMTFQAHMDALKALSATRIVVVTPFQSARNEERRKVLEANGFKVLNMKGLELEKRIDIQKQPPYASYRLAKQAFLEAPEADAIYICCPEWATVGNIARLEADTGKPVVAHAAANIWASLKAMHISDPVRGYGRLLEELP